MKEQNSKIETRKAHSRANCCRAPAAGFLRDAKPLILILLISFHSISPHIPHQLLHRKSRITEHMEETDCNERDIMTFT